MAEAKKVTADYQIVLTLTPYEAETIRGVFNRVGGDCERRRAVDKVAAALTSVGVSTLDSIHNDVSSRSAIYLR